MCANRHCGLRTLAIAYSRAGLQADRAARPAMVGDKGKAMLRFQLNNSNWQKEFTPSGKVVEFGREPQREGVPRCVIEGDPFVSRHHLRVEELPAERVRLINLSTRNDIWIEEQEKIATGGSLELSLPVRLRVGETVIVIEPGDDLGRESLATIAKPIRSMLLEGLTTQTARLKLNEAPDLETLTYWFETVIAVQRAAAGSPEFYQETAQALIDLVGLDCGMVLLRQGAQWQVVAVATQSSQKTPELSRSILRYVLEERRTFYQTAHGSKSFDSSLQNVAAVVASPVFDRQDQVVGAVYGVRARLSENWGIGIGPLEAQVVQILASAVGAGLARKEHEAEAGRLRVQFEQFFSSSLARELERNPLLLEGQEREVTILFSDIRGFSRLSEKLQPRDTCKLVQDVMCRLTDQVRAFDGVVVDYSGDGMMAMWNAPADQPDHATLACRAALAMLGEMPALSEQWKGQLGEPLQIGVGINTGLAMVGNTGSNYKFKYGALGHVVNLASRVEGATKQLGISALITGPTQKLLPPSFATRRLCRARVLGITGAVDLFELYAENAPANWLAQRDVFEQALTHYENKQWGLCCRVIYPLLSVQEGAYDIPSLHLVKRAVDCLSAPPEQFDPTTELKLK